MNSSLSAPLIISKKTGAFVFLIGCTIGLIISEILTANASQAAYNDVNQASAEYLAEARSNSKNLSFILKYRETEKPAHRKEHIKERSRPLSARKPSSKTVLRPKVVLQERSRGIIFLPVREVNKGKRNLGSVKLFRSDKKRNLVTARISDRLRNDGCKRRRRYRRAIGSHRERQAISERYRGMTSIS